MLQTGNFCKKRLIFGKIQHNLVENPPKSCRVEGGVNGYPGSAQLSSNECWRQNQPPALTDEELALLRLMATGKKDRVIASAFNISKRTLRRRAEKICQKLGVEKRIEAVYIVGRRRLLEE